MTDSQQNQRALEVPTVYVDLHRTFGEECMALLPIPCKVFLDNRRKKLEVL
jgi:hypothetical protein